MVRDVWRHRLSVLGSADQALSAARARGLEAVQFFSTEPQDPCGCHGGEITTLAARLTGQDRAKVVRWLAEQLDGAPVIGALLDWRETA